MLLNAVSYTLTAFLFINLNETLSVKIGTSVLHNCIPKSGTQCVETALHTTPSLLSEALQLTATGMSIVFIFLSILVLVVKTTSIIINKYFTAEQNLQDNNTKNYINTSTDINSESASLRAAIFAAVHKFRQTK